MRQAFRQFQYPTVPLHVTRDRDQAIAKALGTLIREVRPAGENGDIDQPERGEREA